MLLSFVLLKKMLSDPLHVPKLHWGYDAILLLFCATAITALVLSIMAFNDQQTDTKNISSTGTTTNFSGNIETKDNVQSSQVILTSSQGPNAKTGTQIVAPNTGVLYVDANAVLHFQNSSSDNRIAPRTDFVVSTLTGESNSLNEIDFTSDTIDIKNDTQLIQLSSTGVDFTVGHFLVNGVTIPVGGTAFVARDGSLPMLGNLDMNGNAITNITTLNSSGPLTIGDATATTSLNLGRPGALTNIDGSTVNVLGNLDMKSNTIINTSSLNASGSLSIGNATATTGTTVGHTGAATTITGSSLTVSANNGISAFGSSSGFTTIAGAGIGMFSNGSALDIDASSDINIGTATALQTTIGRVARPSTIVGSAVNIGTTGATTVSVGGTSGFTTISGVGITVASTGGNLTLDADSSSNVQIGISALQSALGRTGAPTTIFGSTINIGTTGATTTRLDGTTLNIGTSVATTTNIGRTGSSAITSVTGDTTNLNGNTTNLDGKTLNVGTSTATATTLGNVTGSTTIRGQPTHIFGSDILIQSDAAVNIDSVSAAVNIATGTGSTSTTMGRTSTTMTINGSPITFSGANPTARSQFLTLSKFTSNGSVSYSSSNSPTSLFAAGLGSLTYTANTTQVGTVIKLHAWIDITAFSGGGVLSIAVSIDGNAIIAAASVATIVGNEIVEGEIHIRSGGVVFASVALFLTNQAMQSNKGTAAGGTWNTTSSHTVDLTATWSTSSASNALTGYSGYVTTHNGA